MLVGRPLKARGERAMLNMGAQMMRYADAIAQDAPRTVHINGTIVRLSAGSADRSLDEDPEVLRSRLEAVVTFVVDSRYDQIPDDSDASILTAGLLGSQYIGLTAGGSPLSLEDGSEILFTQSAIVLENIIGKFLIGGTSDDEAGSED